jgi:hypothetical protein
MPALPPSVSAPDAPKNLQEVASDEAVQGTERRLRRALKPYLTERSARKKLARAILAEMRLAEPWSQRTWRKQAARHGLTQALDLAENAVKSEWLKSVARYQQAHPTPFPPPDMPAPWPLTQPVSPPETNYHGASAVAPDVIYAFDTCYLKEP